MYIYIYIYIYIDLPAREAPAPAFPARKVDIRLPGEGDSNSHGARPVHLIITMITCFRKSRLSLKNSLSRQTWKRVQGNPV